MQNDDLKQHHETLVIEGCRKLHNYTFSNGEDHYQELLSLAENGTAEAVSAFLRARPDTPLDRPDRASTPLHIAARRGHGEMIAELIRRGAPIERKDAQHASTPLGWACFYGQPEAVQALLDAGAAIDEACVQTTQQGIEGALASSTSAAPSDYRRVMDLLRRVPQKS